MFIQCGGATAEFKGSPEVIASQLDIIRSEAVKLGNLTFTPIVRGNRSYYRVPKALLPLVGLTEAKQKEILESLKHLPNHVLFKHMIVDLLKARKGYWGQSKAEEVEFVFVWIVTATPETR